MKRPMANIGITFLLTLVIIYWAGETFSIVSVVVFAIALIVSLIIKKLRQDTCLPSILMAAIAACLIFFVQTYLEYNPQMELVGKNISFEGTVVDVLGESQSGASKYIVKTDKVDGKDEQIRIRVSTKKLTDADYYDKIRMENATIYELGSGVSKVQNYYKSKGIFIGAYSYGDAYKLKVDKKPFLYNFVKLKRYIRNTINELLPKDEGDVTLAMLIGDKSEMSRELYDSFISAGITHIFAVSGMHLTIWSMFIYNCLRRLGVRRAKSSIMSCLFIIGFMTLTGFSNSVVRAGIMMIIFFGAKIINREQDPFNSLGLAALLITIFNPYSAINTGLLFSFFATFGILICSPIVKGIILKATGKIKIKAYKRIVSVVLEVLLISLSAILFTLPIQIISFGAVSIVSPLANILTLNAAGITMVLSGVGLLISAIPIISVLKMPIFLIGGLLSKYIIWCAKLLSDLPFSYVSLHNDYIIPWIIATVLLVLIAYVLKIDKKRAYKLVSLLSINIFLLSFLASEILNYGVTKMEVVNVGSGTCIVLNRDKNSVVIGCGGEYYAKSNIEKALFMNNTKDVDLMVLPNSCNDIEDCYDSLQNSYKIQQTLQKEKDNDLIATAQVWKDVKIDCYSDNYSKFSTLNIRGFKILVLYSDKCNINEIPKSYQKCDVLICKSVLPKGLDYNNFSNIIISDEKDKSVKKANSINNNGGNATTITKSVIEVKISDDGNFSTRSFEN